MKSTKKLSFKKMNVAQLDAIKGGNLLNTVEGLPSEQPVGGGDLCYSDSPTSCLYCV
ncbi:hypothetical protein [Aquimarina sp. AU474]|uniref:hypothetical protein n=1 Tax=Aquimarina sp. AU474 TaxID=2108529 RepID=UPI0013581BCE|nr:hypothetical protein [Aquimarina sp. AU474]